MGSGGKGGASGASKVYDQFATISAVFAVGPVDFVSALILDKKEVWPGAPDYDATKTYTTNTLVRYLGRTWRSIASVGVGQAPPDPTKWAVYALFHSDNPGDYYDFIIPSWQNSRWRFYWGTSTQAAEPKLQAAGNDAGHDHPPYLNMAYIVGIDALMGRGKQAPPQVEMVLGRTPVQTIVTGASALLSDHQANPMAVLAEILTDPVNGYGVPTSRIDSTSWQAVADALSAKPSLAYVSPIWTEQDTLRSILEQISAIADIWVRWNPKVQKFEAGIFKHGQAPASYAQLSVDDFIRALEITPGGWDDAYTRVEVTFDDRARAFKNVTAPFDDQRARDALQEPRPLSVRREWITRLDQATGHAVETARVAARPQQTINGVVRRQKGSNLLPGDAVLIDVDPTPGGAQLLQFGRVSSRKFSKFGPVEIEVDSDETLPPIPYTPATDNPAVLVPEVVPQLTTYRIFDAPNSLVGEAGYWIGVLAMRENKRMIGFNVHFALTTGSTYEQLGTHANFAIHTTLQANYAAAATGAVTVHMAAQPDSDQLPTQILDSEAADDAWLLVVVHDDGAGNIGSNADNFPLIEIMSLADVTPNVGLGAGYYDLTVSRARRGTIAGDFLAGDEAWIIRRRNLVLFTHAEFKRLSLGAQGTNPGSPSGDYFAYFRLQPYTISSTADLSGATEIYFRWPWNLNGAPVITWSSPDITVTGWNGKSHSFGSSPQSLTLTGFWTDSDNDISSVSVAVRKVGGAEQSIFSADVGGQGSASFSTSFSFTTGEWEIVARATDLFGNHAEDVLSVCIAAVAGKVLTPYFKYDNGQVVSVKIPSGSRKLTKIFDDTAGSTIQYRFVGYGLAGSGAWNNYSGQTVDALALASIGYPSRLWVKAIKAAMTDSDENFVDLPGLHD